MLKNLGGYSRVFPPIENPSKLSQLSSFILKAEQIYCAFTGCESFVYMRLPNSRTLTNESFSKESPQQHQMYKNMQLIFGYKNLKSITKTPSVKH